TATPPTGSTNLTLNWTAAQGAVKYRIERKDVNTSYTQIGTSTSTSLTDNGAVSGTAYLYRVCSADAAGNCTSNYSNIALGAAITFTDPTIISTTDDPTGATATRIRAVHITQLRTAVNAVRTMAGLPNATWTWNAAIGDLIRVEEIRELRTALAAALTALQIDQSAPYTDPTLVGFAENPATATRVKADHFRQLRQRATSGIGAGPGGGATFTLNWLITDNLSTPRIVIDLSGTLNTTRRFDYLPFGEELKSSNGLRGTTLGYADSSADRIRQKFTIKERDNETGLDYFGARYYANVLGRFTSVDPENFQAMQNTSKPQSWNGYSYVSNNPLRSNDPTGLAEQQDSEKVQILRNGLWYGYWMTDAELHAAATAARTQVAVEFMQRDENGLPKPIDLSRVSDGEALLIRDQFVQWRDEGKIPKFEPQVGSPVGTTSPQAKLTKAQQRRIDKIDKIIEDHLTERDIQGLTRDVSRNPVPKPGGGQWDHFKEVTEAVKGLKREIQSLKGSLKNPRMDAATRGEIQCAIDKAQNYVTRVEKIIRSH
ncbi:MAG TPA: polymorphic toxin type 28 domain-containing protein, partial [Pyrinomonadaceae bacterium]|nr:polymorphic toxin type 28 domain-containing protein [Pyrinomonadaceae bacterium]